MELEFKRSLLNMESETSNSGCNQNDCNVITSEEYEEDGNQVDAGEEDEDDEKEESTSINIDIIKRNCTVNTQYLHCDNMLSPIEKSPNLIVTLLHMLLRLFDDESRYKMHQMDVNEEDIMENSIYALLNDILNIIRIDRCTALTKFQEDLKVTKNQWHENYINHDEKSNTNELEWNEIIEISNLNEEWKIIYGWPGEEIKKMIRMIRYPSIS